MRDDPPDMVIKTLSDMLKECRHLANFEKSDRSSDLEEEKTAGLRHPIGHQTWRRRRPQVFDIQ